MGKETVVVLFGGVSSEHEISVLSAMNVAKAIDKNKYNVEQIGISKEGKWLYNPEIDENGCVKGDVQVTLTPGMKEASFTIKNTNTIIGPVDVVFPMLHGTNGEDGTMQGLLEILDLAYVSTGVLGSAIGIDKVVAKRLLECKGIKTAPYLCVKKNEKLIFDFEEVKDKLGVPFFVKPAKLGSSVGVAKVYNEQDYENALQDGFMFDDKLVIEKFIEGRELEVGIFGDKDLVVSNPGEIISHSDFYSYESKYLDKEASSLVVMADLSEEVQNKIKEIAIMTYKVLECDMFARVDVFLSKNDEIVVNEVNTIPGFTEISMFSKVLEASGISYESLIDRLINLSKERYLAKKTLKRNRK